MSYEIINVGELPNDGTGDPVRVAFVKINNNFAAANSISQGLNPNGPDGAIQIKTSATFGQATVDSFLGTNYLKVSDSNLNIGYNILPLGNGAVDIGSVSNTIGNLYLNSSSGLHIGNVKITELGNSLSFVIPGSSAKPSLNLGNLTVQNSIHYSNTTLNSTTATTINDNVNQVVFETPLSNFKTGEFKILSELTNTSRSQYATISVIKDNLGTEVKYEIHGTLFAGTAITRYDAKVSYNNMQITVSPLVNAEIVHTINYQINI
jgi:hypothetical protein